MAGSTPKSFSTDPTLYLYTSLTSGSSHIITATVRLETILKANKVTYQALDVATDDQARMLWGRRAGGKKLPGLVRKGLVIGDLEQIEEWNEYGELKENLEPEPAPAKAQSATPLALMTATTTPIPPKEAAPPTQQKPKDPVEKSVKAEEKPESSKPSSSTLLTEAMRKIGFEAAQKAGENKSKNIGKSARNKPEQTTSVKKSLDQAAIVAPPTGSAEPIEASDSNKTDTTPSEQKSTASTEDVVSTKEKPTTDPEPAVTTHRGSIVATASAEEIKKIEEKTAIPEEEEEEDEEDDDADEKDTTLEDAGEAEEKKAKQQDAKSEEKDTKQEDAEDDEKESEDDGDEEESNTQDQPAAEGELAAVSVGD
ncbi:MAG: hypothetical protein M1823_004464 [Watsoniomyces obsoletus]|nr:MAG: hypothetical protein M1823_004464 [Watsoniomyces obsoletus]